MTRFFYGSAGGLPAFGRQPWAVRTRWGHRWRLMSTQNQMLRSISWLWLARSYIHQGFTYVNQPLLVTNPYVLYHILYNLRAKLLKKNLIFACCCLGRSVNAALVVP